MNNERLEFLGDAVLNAVVSDILYQQYENEQEGFLTNARSNVVKRNSLNELCKQICLDKLLVTTKHIDSDKKNNLYGNALEALIGAIYLDYGYKKCYWFVKNKLFVSLEDMKKAVEDNDNYKSKLIEWCQKYKVQIDFELLKEAIGTDNNHTFHTQVKIEGIEISKATGASKKESQQKASLLALERIEKESDFFTDIINNTLTATE